jgi:hypothetical protein
MKNKVLQPTRIANQEELDDLLNDLKEDHTLHCFVRLNFGLRSSKEISFNANGDYSIFNEIDGSEETIEHDNLMSTFIGEALEKGALYEY